MILVGCQFAFSYQFVKALPLVEAQIDIRWLPSIGHLMRKARRRNAIQELAG
jgi:hypothetical protein